MLHRCISRIPYSTAVIMRGNLSSVCLYCECLLEIFAKYLETIEKLSGGGGCDNDVGCYTQSFMRNGG